MSMFRGKLEVTITLQKTGCYFLRTGKCSLNVVTDYYVSPSAKTSPGDLLYCPRLYRAMRNRERMKPITVLPCRCGHAQVVSGQQRACIASQKNLDIAVRAAGDEEMETCKICAAPSAAGENSGGDRIVTIRALIDKNE